jgi:hypothetical protein
MPEDEPMGEVVDENGTPPPGFTLEAEMSRSDPVIPGIIERPVEPEPEDDELPEIIERAMEPAPAAGDREAEPESGDAEDDDAIDDPANDIALEDI